MTFWSLPFFATAASCFGLTFLGAIFPWINAEIVVLSLSALKPDRPALLALVVVATVGQMLGKCVVYVLARRGTREPPLKVRAYLERWRWRLEARPWIGPLIVFWSALVGVPPLYLTTIAAGILQINFTGFVIAGTTGRLIRFGGLAAASTWFVS